MVVHLSGDIVFDAVIDSVSNDEDLTNIGIKPIICLFDRDIKVNLYYQNNPSAASLEAYINARLDSYWINNSDSFQNLPATSAYSTDGAYRRFNWNLDWEPTSDEVNWNIINFLNDMVIPSFERYGVVTDARLNLQTRKIDFTIGLALDEIIIDADNPMINLIEFMPTKLEGEVNKLIIVDAANYNTEVIYYRHPNGTYNTTDSNRITPVVFKTIEATIGEDETFADVASAKADAEFSKAIFKNYVELETQLNDKLINPLELKIGSKATIYHNKQAIQTMLTGKVIEENYIRLIFGTVRIDYTKK